MWCELCKTLHVFQCECTLPCKLHCWERFQFGAMCIVQAAADSAQCAATIRPQSASLVQPNRGSRWDSGAEQRTLVRTTRTTLSDYRAEIFFDTLILSISEQCEQFCWLVDHYYCLEVNACFACASVDHLSFRIFLGFWHLVFRDVNSERMVGTKTKNMIPKWDNLNAKANHTRGLSYY